ncbi:predicted protein [Chaetoceros tenuissimus]|uniref:Uncharacterized protein n=1 Tax=Chaetoceros tenuissimus TaxID=426638 RepID=A0AAD3CE62_9STRA|nr:predicted protein [Chaetoceros tenuissimus]
MLQFCKLFLLSCLVFSSAEASSAKSRELGYSSYWSSSTTSPPTTSYPTVAPTYSPTNGTDAPTKAPHVQYHGRGYNISDYYPDMDDDQFDYKMMEQQLRAEFEGKTIAEYNFEEILWFAMMVTMAAVLASIPIFLFVKAREQKRFNMKHMDKFLDDDGDMSVYSAYSASTFGSRSLYDSSTHGYSHSSTFTYDEEDARSTRSCESEEDYKYKAPAIQEKVEEKVASVSKLDEEEQRTTALIENHNVEDHSTTTKNVVQDSTVEVKSTEEDEEVSDILSTDKKESEIGEESMSGNVVLSSEEVVEHDETSTDKCASAVVVEMGAAEDNADNLSTIGENVNESTDNKVCSENDMAKPMDLHENNCREDVNEVES